jgi:hypothetical protein
MPDLRDDLFDDGDEGEGTFADSDQRDAGESGDTKDPKSTDKRISDLQSAKDKETARANKLQKQLDAILAASKGDDAETGKPPAASAPSGSGTDAVVLDMARMFAYQQNPKLAEYGISAADLNGSTPSEIAQSAAELVARFEKIETQVRNKVLADQGLAPEIDGVAPAQKPRDFSKMSKEDFQKVMDAALNKSR